MEVVDVECWTSIVFSNILKSPFGCGFDTINNIFASVGKSSADGAALIYDLAALGIQIWLILQLIYCYSDYEISCVQTGARDNLKYYAIPMTRKEANEGVIE